MQENIENLKKFEWFKGDKVLWAVVILISLFSLFPVYSASTNLQYIVNEGTTTKHLIKHAFFVFAGWGLMRAVGFIKYEFIGKLSGIFLFFTVGLLVWAMVSGKQIDGASAARWINIGGISFQPSTFAYLMLIIYICRYLTKKITRERSLADNIFGLFLPILIVFGFVFKDNGSTALIILLVSLIVMALGQFPIKYLLIFGGVASFFIGTFLFLAFNTEIFKGTRVHTWKSRIEVHLGGSNVDIDDETLKAKNYQVDRAKAAIVHGNIFGVGPGKSALKQSLPQSVSDFIFAIIVEEYGLLGAFGLISLYFIMLIRIVMIASKMPAFFGTLLALSIGVMIFVQLAVNIAVAVNLIPVTGQPLPLISYGGTSMLVTYLQLGLVLNISSRIQVLDEEGLGRKQSIQEINDIA